MDQEANSSDSSSVFSSPFDLEDQVVSRPAAPTPERARSPTSVSPSQESPNLTRKAQGYSDLYGSLFTATEDDSDSSSSSSSSTSDLDCLACSESHPLPATPSEDLVEYYDDRNKFYYTRLYTIFEVDETYEPPSRAMVLDRDAGSAQQPESVATAKDDAPDLVLSDSDSDDTSDDTNRRFAGRFDLEYALSIATGPYQEVPSDYEIACRESGLFPVFEVHWGPFTWLPIPTDCVHRSETPTAVSQAVQLFERSPVATAEKPTAVYKYMAGAGEQPTPGYNYIPGSVQQPSAQNQSFKGNPSENDAGQPKPRWEIDFSYTSIGDPSAPRWDEDDDEDW